MIDKIKKKYTLIIIALLLVSSFNITQGFCAKDNRGDDNHQAKKFYYYKGMIQKHIASDNKKAWKYSDSLLTFALSSKNDDFIALAYNNRGLVYTSINLYDKAIQNYLIASKYSKLAKPTTQLVILNNKASLYLTIENPLIAMEVMQEMDRLLPMIDQIDLIANTYQNYALIYAASDQYDSAFRYYMLALENYKVAEKNEDLNRKLTKLYTNLGALYFHLHEINTAIENYKNAFILCENDLYSQSAICLNLGYAFLSQNKLDSSFLYIDKGVAIADSLNYIELQSNGYKFLSAYYEYTEQFEYAKHCLDKHIVFNEKINSANNQEKVWSIQLDFEQKQLQFKIQKQKLIYTFIFIITLLLSSVILLFINRQKIKYRKDGLIGEQRVKISEMHLKNLNLLLERKNQRLQEYASLFKEKNALIESFNRELDILLNTKNEVDIVDRKKKLLSMKILTNEDWDRFKQLFEEVNKGYLQKLETKYEGLTEGDKRQFLLVKLGFDKKESAEMLGISIEGAKRARQRLSKKLKLTNSGELSDFIVNY